MVTPTFVSLVHILQAPKIMFKAELPTLLPPSVPSITFPTSGRGDEAIIAVPQVKSWGHP